jgi:hypothetical protein
MCFRGQIRLMCWCFRVIKLVRPLLVRGYLVGTGWDFDDVRGLKGNNRNRALSEDFLLWTGTSCWFNHYSENQCWLLESKSWFRTPPQNISWCHLSKFLGAPGAGTVTQPWVNEQSLSKLSREWEFPKWVYIYMIIPAILGSITPFKQHNIYI